MRKPFVLMIMTAALAVGATGAGAANPHTWKDLSLDQTACTVTATASWSSVRVARVDFFFMDASGTQYYTPSLTSEPRPARDGSLVAGATVPATLKTGRVDAIFVDAKGDYVAAMTVSYDLADCTSP